MEDKIIPSKFYLTPVTLTFYCRITPCQRDESLRGFFSPQRVIVLKHGAGSREEEIKDTKCIELAQRLTLEQNGKNNNNNNLGKK